MAWADTNYLHKKEITIQASQVAGDETDFPMLISIVDADLTGCLANGFDIKFYESTETTQLDHEREAWNSATGTLVAWVKVPALSSGVNTIIYMYYEYPGELVDQEDPTNVWDANYVLVSHMTGGLGNDTDSTSYANVLNEVGTVGTAAGNNTSASRDFLGTNDYFTIASFPDGHWGAGEHTLESWFKPDAINNNEYLINWGISPLRIDYLTIRNTAVVRAAIRDAALDVAAVSSINNYTTNWHYTVGTRVVDTVYIYLDGNNENNATNAAVDATTALDTKFIGVRGNDLALDYNGLMEEIRVSKSARSDNWISTCWETQDDPAGFMTWSSEESESKKLRGWQTNEQELTRD